MILAGLYDSVILDGKYYSRNYRVQSLSTLTWFLGATNPKWTFTVVTTDASTSLTWLHDRQPVILSSAADLEKWLDTSQGWHKGLIEIMKPGDGRELEWCVSSHC